METRRQKTARLIAIALGFICVGDEIRAEKALAFCPLLTSVCVCIESYCTFWQSCD
jgi:hypothetical protein